MSSYTPLDIEAYKHNHGSEMQLNIVIILLVLITLAIIGFIAYLFFLKFQ